MRPDDTCKSGSIDNFVGNPLSSLIFALRLLRPLRLRLPWLPLLLPILLLLSSSSSSSSSVDRDDDDDDDDDEDDDDACP